MMSFVFNLKYLRQNLVNFNFQGVFWNPQDVQISKLSLDLNFEQDSKEISKVFGVSGHSGAHCKMETRTICDCILSSNCQAPGLVNGTGEGLNCLQIQCQLLRVGPEVTL